MLSRLSSVIHRLLRSIVPLCVVHCSQFTSMLSRLSSVIHRLLRSIVPLCVVHCSQFTSMLSRLSRSLLIVIQHAVMCCSWLLVGSGFYWKVVNVIIKHVSHID